MSAKSIRVIKMKEFDFGSIGDSGTYSVLVADKIDVSQYVKADLVVRIHSATISGTGYIQVSVYQDGYTKEDPKTEFTGDSVGSTAPITSSVSPPELSVSNLDSNPLGSLVKVFVIGSQGTTATSLKATISADLVLREKKVIQVAQ